MSEYYILYPNGIVECPRCHHQWYRTGNYHHIVCNRCHCSLARYVRSDTIPENSSYLVARHNTYSHYPMFPQVLCPHCGQPLTPTKAKHVNCPRCDMRVTVSLAKPLSTTPNHHLSTTTIVSSDMDREEV